MSIVDQDKYSVLHEGDCIIATQQSCVIGRRKFLNTLTSSGIAMMTAGQFGCSNRQNKKRSEEKPNVILIMTDDQGYGELSCHGNPILKTPHLDALARQSVRFSDFHAAPMCAPTRGQLLTGLDAAKNGTVNVSSGRCLLRSELPTMADFFKESGYATGLFGKWHLGDNYPYRPQDRGFKESVWFPSSHISSVPDVWGNDYFNDTYMHNGKHENYKGFCTDVFFEEAIKFMDASNEKDEPFFVYLPTNAPHWPFFAPEKDIQEIEKAYDASFMAKRKFKRKEQLLGFLGMIRNIDTNIHRLRDYLAKNNLDKNTILIFLTDNGSTFASSYYAAGMRGKKAELWEGGHRVPLFIHYPNGNFTEPREVDGITHVQDLLPTLIDLCQLNAPSKNKFDGISLVPQLRHHREAPEDRMLVVNYSRMPTGFDYPVEDGPSVMRKDESVVLWKRWRLVENRELYNLDTDPMQENNVMEQNSDVAEKMREHLDAWWQDVKDKANEVQRVIIGSDQENPIMLTACEWLNVHVDMKFQVAQGIPNNSYWKLQVEQSGTYEFELRRWPKEVDLPLSGAVENGRRLPITQARIYIDGVRHHEVSKPLAFSGLTKAVSPSDTSVKFTIPLKKGPITLHTWFDDNENRPLCGAYYVYVKRLLRGDQ